MPYQISKLKNGKYEVRLKDTGQILSYGTTLTKAKKQIKYLGMIEHMRGGGIHELDNNIQSVLFNKDKHTEKKADKWLKTHNFKIDKSTYNFNNTNYLRYRQHDPDDKKFVYRMHQIDPETDIYFVLEYEKEKKLTGGALKASTKKNVLQSGYKPIDDQAKNIDEYIRDDSLSGRRHQVYYHPESEEAIISHRGTEGSLKDWMNNATYGIGLYHYTDRYKIARDAQKKAEAKYGKNNVNTIGHSQGAMLAGDLGKQTKNIIAVDRPAKLSEVFFKRTGKNHHDIRTTHDLVSSMIPYQNKTNTITTIKSKTYNPIEEHDLNRLDELGDQQIGGSIHKPKPKIKRKRSAWVQHVMDYSKEHNISYFQALKDCSANKT